MEYFPLDFKVSPVCACLHSSLLNTSSPELPPLPSVLGLVFLLFSTVFMLFLPFLFLAKALAVSLMKTVARMQKVFLLCIKTLHFFPLPLQNAHFRIVCLLLSLALFPELPTCCPTIIWFYLSTFFSVLTVTLSLTVLFSFFSLHLMEFSLPSPAHLRLPIAL